MDRVRRYSEKEIAEIFKYAAEAQEKAGKNRATGEGLSLSELQKIGQESRITSEFIAQAAAIVDESRADAVQESLFGVPLVVSRTLVLPRKIETTKWEQLVVDLRRTYREHGAIKQEGSFRQWKGGEISVFVEPTKTGEEIRITTMPERVKGTKVALGMGLFFCIISMFFFIPAFFLGNMIPAVLWPGSLFLGAGLFPLIPFLMGYSWAKKQELNMNGVIVRMKERMGIAGASESAVEADSLDEAESGFQSRINMMENVPEEKNESTSHRPKLRS